MPVKKAHPESESESQLDLDFATSYMSVGKLSSCSRLGDQLHENLISSVKFAEMVP